MGVKELLDLFQPVQPQQQQEQTTPEVEVEECLILLALQEKMVVLE